jgi:PKD repeat protein
MPTTPFPRRLCCASVTAFALALSAAPPAPAQQCPAPANLLCGYLACRAPAFGVPSPLWGELQPVDTGQLPANRDNTDYNEFLDPTNETQPHWMSLDVESGWTFAAIRWGLQIWDGRAPNEASPTRVKVLGSSAFPAWVADPHEDQPVRDLDAPPGNSNLLAVTVASNGGLAIFNTTSKTTPVAKYGDTGKTAVQVYAGHVNGRDYSFTATIAAGLLVHDMTTAGSLASQCLENTPGQQGCGVYKGRLGSRSTFYFVDGVSNAAGTGLWVAGSSSGSAFGLQLWNVSNPASPQFVLTGLPTEFVYGVALWRKGSSYYLATRVYVTSTTTQARIYDVSCLATSSCGSSLGSPLWTRNLPGGASDYYVTYSKSGSRDFLYFGTINYCFQGTQGEWLYDVTSPAQPRDVTPPDGFVDVYGQPTLTGYWGWYYRKNPTGFNGVAPHMGKFNGAYFYRAAYRIFDIHELTTTAPTAAFTYTPQTVYRDEPIDFFDQSAGGPTSWSWTFAGATPASSAARNPTDVVFLSTGAKQVCLTATNVNGSDQHCENVNVLPPEPAVAGVTASPNPALVCQQVSFTAQGVTGLPPLTFAWQVHASGGGLVASGGDVNPFLWDTSSAAPDTYTGTVTVSNGDGSDAADSPTVTVQALPALAFTSPGGAPETLNGPPFPGGEVDFRIQAQGATEWRWHFDDGTAPVWTSDPVAGPTPVHTYADPGDYSVTVDVRNCQQGAITSAPTVVTIVDTSQLVASFQAQGCGSFGCFFNVGQAITFVDQSSGTPTGWRYDWGHTGSDPGSCSFSGAPQGQPTTSHTYAGAGSFQPCLEVTRGPETAVDVHETLFVGAGTPTVTVNGPASGVVGEVLAYSATASSCSPGPTSWSWSVGAGGTISGATTGGSISVSYSTVGQKTIQATAANGGCIGTTGSTMVDITNPSLLFADGFESGDTAAWSSQVP